MPRVLVTGGTGVLGSALVPRFAAAGYNVRIMSRHPAPAEMRAAGEWAQADLATGEGLPEAVAGADLIAHCASATIRAAGVFGGRAQRSVDVEGTRRLLEATGSARRPHVFYISIVGIDRIPLGYYQKKVAAEQAIIQSGKSYSVLRAVQFHDLIDDFLRLLIRLPIAFVPRSLKFQPIDAGDVADRIVQYAAHGPGGRLPDLGGPEVRSFGDLASAWLKARRKRALLLPLPTVGRTAACLRNAYNCTPDHAEGKVSWEQWLARKYPSEGRVPA